MDDKQILDGILAASISDTIPTLAIHRDVDLGAGRTITVWVLDCPVTQTDGPHRHGELYLAYVLEGSDTITIYPSYMLDGLPTPARPEGHLVGISRTDPEEAYQDAVRHLTGNP